MEVHRCRHASLLGSRLCCVSETCHQLNELFVQLFFFLFGQLINLLDVVIVELLNLLLNDFLIVFGYFVRFEIIQ